MKTAKLAPGRTIDLNVVVLPAVNQETKAEPLFDLAGGPGASSADGAGFYAGPGKDYRRRHDVVCVDQRGTGKPNRLAIPREKTSSYYLSEMYPIDYVKEMREFRELIDHLRGDINKINEAKAQALFEAAAEVISGLDTAFKHHEENSENAWKQSERNQRYFSTR